MYLILCSPVVAVGFLIINHYCSTLSSDVCMSKFDLFYFDQIETGRSDVNKVKDQFLMIGSYNLVGRLFVE